MQKVVSGFVLFQPSLTVSFTDQMTLETIAKDLFSKKKKTIAKDQGL